MMSEMVYVVDDDPAVRDALQLLLVTEGYCVKTFASAATFLVEIGADSGGCVVADVRMPKMSGLDLLVEIKRMELRLPVIIITGHGDVPLAVEAMKRGAVDFLEKPFDDEALFQSVKRAMTHGALVQSRYAEGRKTADKLMMLTKREREILERLAEGRSNKVIAHELGISVRTAEVHRANVMTKMRAKNIAELIRMVLAGSDSSPPLE